MRTALTLMILIAGLAGQDRPNVVILLADDMGSGDPRCSNPESRVPTPNIDRIAREGVRLTDAHSPSSVCTPTRYGVLTGRYCWRSRRKSGVGNGYSPALIEPGRLTIASILKAKGYHTACVGKWHLGFGSRKRTDYDKPLRPGPLEVGFDTFFGIPASLDMAPYCFVKDRRPTAPINKDIAGSGQVRNGGGGFWRKGKVADGFRHVDVQPTLVTQAVSYIEQRAKTKQPFFLYLPFAAPHTPWLPTEPYQGKAEGAGPYGDFAHMVDAGVGAVLAALDRTDTAKNTLIVFTSDNGAHWTPGDKKKYPHRANVGLRGQKADIWEGGHRVPFVARLPGRIPAGRISPQIACLTDLFATIAGVVGAELPDDAAEDSFDLSPSLFGGPATGPQRANVVHHSVSGKFAVRVGRYKLILGLGSGGFSAPRNPKPKEGGPKVQLYDLVEDPTETTNLWKTKPEVVTRLTSVLDRLKSAGRSR
ncbi:MAG: arylsulfatase [Planctomycetota bacterium]|nr:arylsulfatase [Planctomycetota bacterium]